MTVQAAILDRGNYLNRLPELGPLQMVVDYSNGGMPISMPPICSHFIGEENQFSSLSLSALDRDGNVVVYEPTGLIHIFKPNGTCIKSITCPSLHDVCGFTVGPDNNFYLSDYISVHICNRSGLIEVMQETWNVVRLAFADDGCFLLTNLSNAHLQFYDSTRQLRTSTNLDKGYFPGPLAWDPFTKTFAVAEETAQNGCRIGFYTYNQETNSLDCTGHKETPGTMSALCFDRLGNLVVVFVGGHIYIYDSSRHLKSSMFCRASSVSIDVEGRIFMFDNCKRQVIVWK